MHRMNAVRVQQPRPALMGLPQGDLEGCPGIQQGALHHQDACLLQQPWAAMPEVEQSVQHLAGTVPVKSQACTAPVASCAPRLRATHRQLSRQVQRCSADSGQCCEPQPHEQSARESGLLSPPSFEGGSLP